MLYFKTYNVVLNVHVIVYDFVQLSKTINLRYSEMVFDKRIAYDGVQIYIVQSKK